MKITEERLSALVGFVYQGIKQLENEDRVEFLRGLGQLFCPHCGRDLDAWTNFKCYCMNED